MHFVAHLLSCLVGVVLLSWIALQSYGDYSGGVSPLPIPNREVKPVSADGTALCGGRVGRCPFAPPCYESNAEAFL